MPSVEENNAFCKIFHGTISSSEGLKPWFILLCHDNNMYPDFNPNYIGGQSLESVISCTVCIAL